jgi:hypothetical protein
MFGDPTTSNIEDNLDIRLNEFLRRRQVDLHHRFPGWYRAIVEETNDPLQIRRARVRVPELHNNDVKIEDLPWASPAPGMGGPNAGVFYHPIIKDIVFVCFEKGHPYGPIYCASADPTRRRMYSMFSIYTKSPQAVDKEGNPAEKPTEFLEDYLPKDGRPMNSGMVDRYGNYLLFNAYGFAPKEHMVKPASVGTDALTKRDYDVNKSQPKENEPDLKYIALGTKYGHTAVWGDIGYKWSEEFKGDFEQDKGFEQSRYQYLLKYYNEQMPKDRDQRRIDIRTRLGHKFELRDVGWDKSRSGEYEGGRKTIGDSKGRDERWVKLRTKGGHLIQGLDMGFDPENDNFYNRLNKTEFGSDPYSEATLGKDARMLRFITRHGNQLILDDRGTSATSAEDEKPDGNGVLLRTRRGYQIQMVDKTNIDHILFATPKEQCFEINDKFQHIILSTTQSDELHTVVKPREIYGPPKYVTRTGLTNDPESNTCHLKLDKINDYVRLKTPDGAGFEARGKKAPCGQWTESRDSENRAVWMSVIDQWLLIRNKTGELYIVMDDKDDAIMIRNEKGRIVIHAKKDIHIKSDDGDICLEAPKGQIGMKAQKIAVETQGALHVMDSGGIGTTRKVQGQTLSGTHDAIQIPLHPLSPAPPAPRGVAPCKFNPKIIARKKPEDFDKERGCDPVKPKKGPFPPGVFGGPGGGGAGSGGGPPPPPLPNSDPPPLSPTAPMDPSAEIPSTPDPQPNPIDEILIQAGPDSKGNEFSGDGVLWYGVSVKFQDEIEEFGLLIESFVNHLNIPPEKDTTEIRLAKSLEIARGKKQAILSQQRYGDFALILRIRNLPDSSLLSVVEDDLDVIAYKGDIPFDDMEIYEIGETKLTQPPFFPNVS